MTGPATFRLWIAFGIDPLDDTSLDAGPDTNWVDVTDDVRSASFGTSERSTLFDTFAAGQGVFVLDNRARLYDPAYAAGTHFGDFKRSTPIRVTAEHSSTRYTVWSGYVMRWLVDYISSVESTTTVQAVDMLGLIGRYDLDVVASSYGGDTTAERIGRVLDDIGVPSAYRSLNNGGNTATLEATTWGTNALRHLVEAATADGGLIYVDRDGVITHDTRNAPAIITRQASSQQSVDDTAAPAYNRVTMGAVGDNYRDLVRVSASVGDVQTVDNTTADQFPVTFQKLGTPLESEGQAAAVANFYADLYGTALAWPVTVTFTVASSGSDLRTVLLQRRVRDRVDVTVDPPGGGADGAPSTVPRRPRPRFPAPRGRARSGARAGSILRIGCDPTRRPGRGPHAEALGLGGDPVPGLAPYAARDLSVRNRLLRAARSERRTAARGSVVSLASGHVSAA